MSREPFASRDKSQEFDITSLTASLGGKSGLFCLSETTWELCYNLLLFYGFWRSRYYYTDPITGEQLTITDEEYTQVTDIVELAIEELQQMGCEEIVAAIEAGTVALGDINTTLADIKTSIDAMVSAQVPVEEINDIEEILDGIGIILGAAAVLP